MQISFISAMNVGKPLAKGVTSSDMKKSTLERDLMSAVNVGKPSAESLTSMDTRKFT